MKGLALLKSLGPIDARSVQRDALLRWMILLPLLIGLLTRWFLPAVAARLGEFLQVDLAAVYPTVIGASLLLITPFLLGTVIGFLLLDQRDDGTLVALLVTPLSLGNYLAYRLAVPMALSVVLTMMVLSLSEVAGLGLLPLLVVAVAAAPHAPLIALALAAFARNKVEGFAVSKVSGIFLLPAIIAAFVPPGWEWPFALSPSYWPAALLRHLQAGRADAWFYAVGALFYQGLLLLLLARRFQRIMHR